MSKRKLKQVSWSSEPLRGLPTDDAALIDWLKGQAVAHDLSKALIHADDGVIWGVFDGDSWAWSCDAFPDYSPRLRWKTIQQVRLFGANAEVLAWREDAALKGRIICDVEAADGQACFDEKHVLWGRVDGQAQNRFLLMREGAQAMHHAPPEAIAREGHMTARNYIDYDASGCAFVKASRLMA